MMDLGRNVERLIAHWLNSPTGREIEAEVRTQDVTERRELVAERDAAVRTLEHQLTELGGPRAAAQERVRRARVELDAAQEELAGVDRDIRAVRAHADRRAFLAECALRASTPPTIEATLRDLRHLAERLRLTVSGAESWPRNHLGNRRRVVVGNSEEIRAVCEAIAVRYQRIDALTLEAGEDVDAIITEARQGIAAVAREHGVLLSWPTDDDRRLAWKA